MDLQVIFSFLFPLVFHFPPRFQPNAAGQANLCAQEPDMRLCNCFHHQRHAHRGQSGAAEWHEIGATALSALTTT